MKSIFEHQSSVSGKGFAAKEYRQTYFTSPFHFHDLYELIWIEKSYGKLYAGNKVMNFKENEVYFFGPGFPHCFYNEKSFIHSGEMAEATAIFFRKDFLGKDLFLDSEMIKIKTLLDKSEFGIKVNAPDRAMLSCFHDITKKGGMESLIMLMQLLNALSNQKPKNISLINTRISKASFDNSDLNRLESVFKYIIENFKEDLSSKTAASLACLNEAAFCRYFKSRTEYTFSQFVNQVRVTHATKLLLKEDCSISNICYECGFRNLSYFNRQFRTIIGQSPAAYRKAFQQSDDRLVAREE